MQKGRRLPAWMKMQRASGKKYSEIKRLVAEHDLHTICTSGNCPNIGECWNSGTATFMILGDICTRSCKFCATTTGKPLPPDPGEPSRLAESIRVMALNHCVITSVDRDDLPDGGAGFWAETIRIIREVNRDITIETLIPDFDGRREDVDMIIDAGPDIISHNLETVKRLTPLIRSKAEYERSLQVLQYISGRNMTAKSGFMLGLGEEEEEIIRTLSDIYSTGCRIVTIGQYLKPAEGYMEVAEYITPSGFAEYKELALEMGFSYVESAPLVRSSYHSENHVNAQKIDYINTKKYISCS